MKLPVYSTQHYRISAIAAIIGPFIATATAIGLIVVNRTPSIDAKCIAIILVFLTSVNAILFIYGYYQLAKKHNTKMLKIVSILGIVYPIIDFITITVQAWTQLNIFLEITLWLDLLYSIALLFFAAGIYELKPFYVNLIEKIRAVLIIQAVFDGLIFILSLSGLLTTIGFIAEVSILIAGVVCSLVSAYFSARLFFNIANGKVAQKSSLNFVTKTFIVLGMLFIFEAIFGFSMILFSSAYGENNIKRNESLNTTFTEEVLTKKVIIIGCPHTDRISPTSLCYQLPATILTINGSHNNEIDILDEVTLPNGQQWFAYDPELGSETQPTVTIDDNGTEWAFATQNSLTDQVVTPK